MTAIAQSWLDVQCGIIPGVVCAAVMRQETQNGSFKKGATWPADVDDIPEELLSVISQAAERRTAVIRNNNRTNDDQYDCIVASPLISNNKQLGIAALKITGKNHIKTQDVLKFLHWGSVWLNLLQEEKENKKQSNHLVMLLEVLVGSLEYERFNTAAKKVVNDLASHFNCERVSIGLLKSRHIKVHAMSHSTRIDERSNLVKNISSAMEEAVDQDTTTYFPALINVVPQVSFAQEVLYSNNDGHTVCSTPLFSDDKPIGALTFELKDDQELDQEIIEVYESLGAMLGPILEMKYRNDRPLIVRLWNGTWRLLNRLLGFNYLAVKILLILFICGVTYISTTYADYRVTAPATIKAASKQLITVPQNGFIMGVAARAGDKVEKGQLLATLDEKDLMLEQLQIKSELEQYIMERRAGLLESKERARVAIAAAQIKQADARLRLIKEQIERTRIRAPFDGIIVSGDLEESLGTPFERGQALFEIAPIERYRLRIEVDEKDIGDIKVGYEGKLLLTSMPNKPVLFKVERLLPVSEAKEGRNMFQLEASLDDDNSQFRPGMEGVAKINVDQRRIIAIWFHELLHWAKLQFWYWLG